MFPPSRLRLSQVCAARVGKMSGFFLRENTLDMDFRIPKNTRTIIYILNINREKLFQATITVDLNFLRINS